MRINGYYLRFCAYTGIFIIVIGAIVALLFKKEITGAGIILIGVFAYIVPCFVGRSVYVCPKCHAEFTETNDDVTLITSMRGFHRALLTCPKCKKTNFMKKKLISKEEFKG